MFRSYSAMGRDRHSCVLESMVRLSDLVGSLRACAFSGGDPDRETRGRGNGVGGEAWARFCVNTLALPCFPRGVRWGYAPQTGAKESLTPWTLFMWVAAWVRFTRRGALGYNEDLPGSNLWPGKSCGYTNAPIYASP